MEPLFVCVVVSQRCVRIMGLIITLGMPLLHFASAPCNPRARGLCVVSCLLCDSIILRKKSPAAHGRRRVPCRLSPLRLFPLEIQKSVLPGVIRIQFPAMLTVRLALTSLPMITPFFFLSLKAGVIGPNFSCYQPFLSFAFHMVSINFL